MLIAWSSATSAPSSLWSAADRSPRRPTELGYTQSAVSQQVAALELELGHQLLLRRPVRPTPVGERLVEHATRILLRVDVARSELAQLDRCRRKSWSRVCPLAAPVAARLGAPRAAVERHRRCRVTVGSIDPASAAAEVASGRRRPGARGRDHRAGRAAQRRRRRAAVVGRARGSPHSWWRCRPITRCRNRRASTSTCSPMPRGSWRRALPPPAAHPLAGAPLAPTASGRLRRQRPPDVARPRRRRARRGAAPGAACARAEGIAAIPLRHPRSSIAPSC